MRELYNNIVDFLGMNWESPVWSIVIVLVVYIVLLIITVSKSIKALILKDRIDILEHNIKNLDYTIGMQAGQLRRKENLLKEAQNKLAEYRPQVIEANREKISKLEVEHKVGAKIGQSRPSTNKDLKSHPNSVSKQTSGRKK